MTAPLETFRYHAADAAPALRPQGADAGPDADPFTSNEAAARYYLDELLREDARPAALAVVEPDTPGRVPGLVVSDERDLRPLGTHQIRFTQTHRGIPVFGARAVVELTGTRDLVSVNAALDEVGDVDPVETLSRAEAVQRVADLTGAALPRDAGLGGHLTFFKEPESGRWHLAWLLTEIPAAPPSDGGYRPEGHGLGPRPTPASYHYLVDAHDGAILFSYSAAPTALPTPVRCSGTDEDEATQKFFGAQDGTGFVLDDRLRAVRTYDLDFADLDTDPQVPARPVAAPSGDFAATNRAAVSAHVNAGRVQDFYKQVLHRDGIDDQGMTVLSLVNVTAASMQPPPELLNAFWWQQRMWYGQVRRDGRLTSLSRLLSVVAHELTHGVVETTSGLVYATQSGALNESFADIAGVIIDNWYTAPDRHDVGTWNWEIGAGLRPDGRPLRDLADPTRTGHPAHLDQFRALAPGERPGPGNDQGWVHFNSNIHNKAAHHLLTMPAADGSRVFTVEDVAILTYLGMSRLTPLATFSDARRAVQDVGRTYFGGSADRDAKVAAIGEAYRLVGIH